MQLARAQRTPDGKYYVKGLNADGDFVDVGDGAPFTEGRQTMELPLTTHLDMTQPHTFVTVISANSHDIDGTLVISTYGTEIKSNPVATFTLSVDNLQRSAPWAASPKWLMSYAGDVTLTSDVPDGLSHYLYRLWRVNPDGSETLLNGHDEDTGSNAGGSWATTYGNLASNAASVTVHDIFNDLPLYTFDNQTFDVSYIARLYSCYGNATTSGQGMPRRAYTSDDYTVSQARQTVTYSMDVVTSVGVVEQGRMPMGTTYYDLTGKAGTKPHRGVNIVVTHYSDGTVTTCKLVR